MDMHTHTGVRISEMDSLIDFSLCIDLCNHHPDKAMESFQCTRRLPGAMMRRAETIGLKKKRKNAFLLLKKYLLIFGCSGSLLLHGLLSSYSARASHCSGFPRCRAWALGFAGFSSCCSRAVKHRLCSRGLGLVALQHVGSSWIRDQTCVSSIGRRILYH